MLTMTMSNKGGRKLVVLLTNRAIRDPRDWSLAMSRAFESCSCFGFTEHEDAAAAAPGLKAHLAAVLARLREH